MQHRDLSRGAAQQREGVVLDVDIPKACADQGFDFLKVAAEMPQQIHHVDALVDQDASAGDVAAIAPVRLKPSPPGLSIDASGPKDFPHLAAVDQRLAFQDPVVIAVIESKFKL